MGGFAIGGCVFMGWREGSEEQERLKNTVDGVAWTSELEWDAQVLGGSEGTCRGDPRGTPYTRGPLSSPSTRQGAALGSGDPGLYWGLLWSGEGHAGEGTR